MIREWSRGQWLLRTVVLAGPLVALLATVPAGSTPGWWLILLVIALGGTFAVFPESPTGTAAFVVVLAWWGIGLRDGLHPVALVAAAGLLASHLAATVAAYGPSSIPVDPAAVRRWMMRGAVVLPVAVLTWGLTTVARDQPEPPMLWPIGLAGLLVALVAANLLYLRRAD